MSDTKEGKKSVAIVGISLWVCLCRFMWVCMGSSVRNPAVRNHMFVQRDKMVVNAAGFGID